MLYLVEFEKNKSMKIKNSSNNCVIKSNIYQFINIITYDEYTIFINN